MWIIRVFALLMMVVSVPSGAQVVLPVEVVPPAVPSVAGTVGYYAYCWDDYIMASTPQLVGYACARYMNAVPNTIAAKKHYYFTATSCPSTMSNISGQYTNCSLIWREGDDQRYGSVTGLPILLGTFGKTASCASGISTGNGIRGYVCVGERTCPSGIEKDMTVFNCSGEFVKDGVCMPGRGALPDRVPALLSDGSCEFAVARPLVSNGCWQSSANYAVYCGYRYVSDGALSSSMLTRAMTSVATSKSVACAAGGCPVVSNPEGDGSDGTTGGTGTLVCGGVGQFPCANGIASGTTSCDGEGLPVCDTSGETVGGGDDESGGAAVCGGPGLPPCQVVNAAAAPVCGGPGLPPCTTDAAPVCGSPGLPACVVADVESRSLLSGIADFFGGPSDAAADPVSVTTAELYSAGLDGGLTFSALAGWTLPAHTSTCPVGSFSLWGKVFVIDAQCDFAARNLSSLRSVMVLVFAVSALILIMKA